jgi:hypothetical protein
MTLDPAVDDCCMLTGDQPAPCIATESLYVILLYSL